MLGMNERLEHRRHVYWPSALSWMFSSLHTAVGFAVVVVGEYLGSAARLGYLIRPPKACSTLPPCSPACSCCRPSSSSDMGVTLGREAAAGLAAGCGRGQGVAPFRNRRVGKAQRAHHSRPQQEWWVRRDAPYESCVCSHRLNCYSLSASRSRTVNQGVPDAVPASNGPQADDPRAGHKLLS